MIEKIGKLYNLTTVHIGKSGLPRVHLDLLLQVLTKAIRSILQCDSDC